MKKRSHLLAGLGLVLALASALGLTGTLAACGSRSGDPPADPGDPSALGTGLRLRNVMNPSSPDHPDVDAGVEVSVAVTGASVTWIDTYDETANGKSLGTVYVQDVASQKQYSGSSLYAPDYFPASLAPAPGDVLDLTGDFEELPNIGTAVFSGGATLPQFSHPVATFRYEYTPPTPVEIQASDLADYPSGRRYLNMLVTIKNVTITSPFTNSGGRVTANITSDTQNGPDIDNELIVIDPSTYDSSQTFTSVTGIVTWFFNFHVAPRTPADLQTQ